MGPKDFTKQVLDLLVQKYQPGVTKKFQGIGQDRGVQTYLKWLVWVQNCFLKKQKAQPSLLKAKFSG